MVEVDKTLKWSPNIDTRSLPTASSLFYTDDVVTQGQRKVNNTGNNHYKQTNIEAIEVINDWNLNFNLGSVVKYIARCDFKEDRLKDLNKALDYLKLEIEKEVKFRKDVGVK